MIDAITASDTDVDGAHAAEVVSSYAKSYARRNRRHGRAFPSSTPNALAGYLVMANAVFLGKPSERDAALTLVEKLAGSVLEHDTQHSPATDIAGLTFARAYGTLPLETPPLAELDLVLESGAAQGAIPNVHASAWRALFLAAGLPLFNWRNRARAEQQAVRWQGYLLGKLETLADEQRPAADPASASQTARLSFLAGSLGDVTGGPALTALSRRILATVAVDADDDGCPMVGGERLRTAHCAHIALAAHSTGDRALRDNTITFLLSNRVRAETDLLSASDDPAGSAELSPWAPLALLAVSQSSAGRGRAAQRMRAALGHNHG